MYSASMGKFKCKEQTAKWSYFACSSPMDIWILFTLPFNPSHQAGAASWGYGSDAGALRLRKLSPLGMKPKTDLVVPKAAADVDPLEG